MMALSVTPNETLDLGINTAQKSSNQSKTARSEKSQGENSFLSVLKSKSKDALSSENVRPQEKTSSAKETVKSEKTSAPEKTENTAKSDNIADGKTSRTDDKSVSPEKDIDPVNTETQSDEEISQAAEVAAEEFAPTFVQQPVPEENEISMEIDVVEQTSSIDLPVSAEENSDLPQLNASQENTEIQAELNDLASTEGTAKVEEAVPVQTPESSQELNSEGSFEQAMAQAEASMQENKAALSEAKKTSTTEEKTSAKKIDSISENETSLETENVFAESLKEAGENIDHKKEDAAPQENPIKVVDLRTANPEEEQAAPEITKDSTSAAHQNSNDQPSVNFATNVQQNITSSSDQSAQASGSTFQQMVNQQVERNIPEFVKAGSIVLKDNNQGSIKLNLKPEALGNVKFNLQISDNKITGEITVASKEALEAFKQNLDQLKTAFQQNGFESADLNLNLADNSGNFNQSGNQEADGQYRANRAYGDYSVAQGEAIETVEPSGVYFDGSDYKVNVVA